MNGRSGQNGGGIKILLYVLLGLIIFRVAGGTIDAGTIDANSILRSLIQAVKVISIVGIVAIALIVILLVGLEWWNKRKEQKNKEAQQTIDILNAPLETFADLELQQLMEQYDEPKPGEKKVQSQAKGSKKKGQVNPYSASNNIYSEGERAQTR